MGADSKGVGTGFVVSEGDLLLLGSLFVCVCVCLCVRLCVYDTVHVNNDYDFEMC